MDGTEPLICAGLVALDSGTQYGTGLARLERRISRNTGDSLMPPSSDDVLSAQAGAAPISRLCGT